MQIVVLFHLHVQVLRPSIRGHSKGGWALQGVAVVLDREEAKICN